MPKLNIEDVRKNPDVIVRCSLCARELNNDVYLLNHNNMEYIVGPICQAKVSTSGSINLRDLRKTSKKLSCVFLADNRKSIVFLSPYNKEVLAKVKSLPQRRYNSSDKIWSAPITKEALSAISWFKDRGFAIDSDILNNNNVTVSEPTNNLPLAKVLDISIVKNNIVLQFPFDQNLSNYLFHNQFYAKWDKVKKVRKIKLGKAMGKNRILVEKFNTLLESDLVSPYKVNLGQSFLDWKNDCKAYTEQVEEQKSSVAVIKELSDKVDEAVGIEAPTLLPLRPYQKKGWMFLQTCKKGILGDEMGLGKCLGGNSMIFINGFLKSIEDIWDEYKHLPIVNDELGSWIDVSKENLIVNSVNDIGQIVESKIGQLYRQYVKEPVRKITFADGNELILTKSHQLLSLTNWKNDFSQNDYINVPKQLKFNSGNDLNLDLVTLMAWQIGEGCETKPRVCIYAKDTHLLQRVKDKAFRFAQDFNIKINSIPLKIDKKKCSFLNLSSIEYKKFIIKYFNYNWGQKAANKFIPDKIVAGSNKVITTFLQEYFTCEGSVSKSQRIVEISSASYKIIQQLNVMLRRLGIWLRTSRRMKCATNGLKIKRPYYIGIIGGHSLRTFQEKVGFIDNKHQQILNEICKPTANPNVETIPIKTHLHNLQKTLQIPKRHFGIETTYFNNTQNVSHTTFKILIDNIKSMLDGTKLQEYITLPKSKWTEKTITAYNTMDKSVLTNALELYEQLYSMECNFNQITNIEEFYYEGYVYDLEIPKYHNFIANNTICHNTAQATAFMVNRGAFFVVCPASLMYNWQSEIEKFSNLRSEIVTSKGFKYNPLVNVYILSYGILDQLYVLRQNLSDEEYNIIEKNLVDLAITKRQNKVLRNRLNVFRSSYVNGQLKTGLAKKDLRYLRGIPELIDAHPDVAKINGVVIDESHYFANYKTKRHANIFNLFAKKEYRILLSGTNIRNRVSEFFPQLQFIAPDEFDNFFQFAIRYCNGHRGEYGWDFSGASHLNELYEKISPYFLRRLKKDVLEELPELQRTIINLPMDAKVAKEYQAIEDEYTSNLNIGKAEHLVKIGKLKKYLSLAKVEQTIEFVDTILQGDNKVVLFTQYLDTMAKLTEHYGNSAVCIKGDMPSAHRFQVVEEFQNNPDIKVIVITKAGKEGLTLTAASYMIKVDLLWTPGDHCQIEARIHRIGQNNGAKIYYMIVRGSLEEKIYEILSNKFQILSQTLDNKVDTIDANVSVLDELIGQLQEKAV